jgi:uncharacterized protein involved in exopolysaccharide biosynthesis
MICSDVGNQFGVEQVKPTATDPFAMTRIAPLDLARLLYVVWSGKWIIACAVAVFVWFAGYYGFHIAQPRYTATATLRIDPQPVDLRDVSEHWPAPPTDLASLNTDLAILTSDRILSQVVRDADLLADPEFNRYLAPPAGFSPNALRSLLRQLITGIPPKVPDEAAVLDKTIANLRAALSARHPPETYLLTLSASSRAPEKAVGLANATAATYVADQIAQKDAAARADIDWLGARVAELRQQLQSQEAAITDLLASAQIAEASDLDALSEAVRDSQLEQTTLIAAIAALPDRATSTQREAATRAQLTTELAALTDHTTRITAQLASQSAGLAALDQSRREAEATRVLYQAFLARLQEAQVQRGLDAADARILAPATTARYSGPRRVLLIEVSALLGGIFGLGLVTLRHLGRRGILHPAMLAEVTGQTTLMSLDTAEMADASGKDAAQLRTSIFLANKRQLPQVVLVTGADGQSGERQIIDLLITGAALETQRILLLRTASTAETRPTPEGIARETLRAPDLLRPDALQAQVRAWRKDYDLIILEAGPVAADPDTALLATQADFTLFAVRWAKTTMSEVREGQQALKSGTEKPIGFILTGTQPRKMRHFARCYPASSGPTERAGLPA